MSSEIIWKYEKPNYEILLEKLEKLQKENQELKEDNSHQWKERCRLTFELEELKEENEKINKVADKMYEYISYYCWEDFESNTGCNREEMVDYFYKE